MAAESQLGYDEEALFEHSADPDGVKELRPKGSLLEKHYALVLMEYVLVVREPFLLQWPFTAGLGDMCNVAWPSEGPMRDDAGAKFDHVQYCFGLREIAQV
jgi:hypothetical protein